MRISRRKSFTFSGWGLACLLLLICCCPVRSHASRVVYVGTPGTQETTRQQISDVAHFYGLDVDYVPLEYGTALPNLKFLDDHNVVAVIVAADTLAWLDPKRSSQLLHKRVQGVPLLIAGIGVNTSPALLRSWSSGSVTASHLSRGPNAAEHIRIADAGNLTRQLSGTILPSEQKEVTYLDVAQPGQSIVESEVPGAALPILARAVLPDGEVFFGTEQATVEIPVSADPYRQQRVFASLAIPMIFLEYAAGDRAWHTPGHYANFTLDDLWLREPYGHVSYSALLREAQLHHFHATIAFIPWNYDRSQPAVAELFRDHPDLLSICIHGDDHVHQEFGDFATHPLSNQTRAMAQAVARMDRFRELTQVSYDPVMVFPHSISPSATLAALRQNNYLGTVNSLNVPSDAAAPPGLDFSLRTATVQFSSFPSLRRYSAETDIPPAQLAIDAFLGNPMMFYAHESFFASGAHAFNDTADAVNRIQPDTQWRSTGDVLQHLYLERRRDDGDVDVAALSGTIRLTNRTSHDATYIINKLDDPPLQPIVLVDGQVFPFLRTSTGINLRLPIAAGGQRLVQVRYPQSNDLATVDIARGSPRTFAIRLLSDFRDNVVSNTLPGRWFIQSYARNGSYWIGASVLLLFAVVVLRGTTALWHKRRSVREVTP